MKIKLLFTLLFLMYLSVFSQNHTSIKGTVRYGDFPSYKIEVANFNSKQVVTTDSSGRFSIKVKENEELVFISKYHYIKKISIDLNTLKNPDLIVSLDPIVEQLEEILITKIPSIRLSKNQPYEQTKIDALALEKGATSPEILGVYTGDIKNGMNIPRMAGLLIGLLAKEKEEAKKNTDKVEFITLAKKNCTLKFYLDTLQLKPDEIALFLQFCEADSKASLLIENYNLLSLMDFLYLKNQEFKRL